MCTVTILHHNCIQIYIDGVELTASEYAELPSASEVPDILGQWTYYAAITFGSGLGPAFYIDKFNFWTTSLSSEDILDIYGNLNSNSHKVDKRLHLNV